MKYMPLSVAERFISELAEKKGARDEGDEEFEDIERAPSSTAPFEQTTRRRGRRR